MFGSMQNDKKMIELEALRSIAATILPAIPLALFDRWGCGS